MKKYRITTPRNVLILGSGGQKIGQSGEFDYAGLQAIRTLSAENIRTILINPNMTAVQTSEGLADATYFLPVTPEFVVQVIEKEKPDSIVINFGGDTAISCAIDLARNGILEKFNIQVLGTGLETIESIVDREKFLALLRSADIPVPPSASCVEPGEILSAADTIGFPVMVHRENMLNGTAPGVCENRSALVDTLGKKDSESRITVETWHGGWKNIELEILHDAMDNCAMVCSMENIDPVGIHSGDSVTVIPAQSLSGDELQNLRKAAFSAIRTLGIIGEATVQFAKDPDSPAFYITDITTGVSRSTALASRATGLHLGAIAAKVALGFSLTEIANTQNGLEHVCYEPVFDYLMVKFPLWDPWKYSPAERMLGLTMKSVGQAIAAGTTFCEALQKAVRTADPESPGIAAHPYHFKNIKEALRNPDHQRIFAVYSALAEDWTVSRIHKYAGIDPIYISALKQILSIETALRNNSGPLTAELLTEAKKAGFSDHQIALCTNTRADKIRALRKELLIRPAVKQIDMSAGMGESRSTVAYMTYHGVIDDLLPCGQGVLLPGSGPYHIGSGIEYDWCTVQAAESIKRCGQTVILVNGNPESVATDPQTATRVYIEELSTERLLDIHEFEKPTGVMLSYGGQNTSRLAIPLSRYGVTILGTTPENMDRVKNLHKFCGLLDALNLDHPEWKEITDLESAYQFAHVTGYPLFVSPKAHDPGVTAGVAWDAPSLKKILQDTYRLTADRAVTLSPYVENSKEIEIDAVADNGEILLYAIGEHIENAGIHSGNATVVLPAQRIYLSTARAIKKAAGKIARELAITGPFTMRFFAKSTNISVIDCTVRASRTVPFCSKVFRTNFIDFAVRAQLGLKPEKVDGSTMDIDYAGVRAAQFSHALLKGTDPVAGVEMTSTGEVGCLGRGVRDAFLKALLATGLRIPKKKILLSTGPLENKVDFVDSARKLQAMGYTLAASGGTARFLQNNGIPAEALAWPLEKKKPNIADALSTGEIDLVINIPKNNRETELKNDYSIRRLAIDYDIPLITNIKLAKQFTDSLEWYKKHGLDVKNREEYKK